MRRLAHLTSIFVFCLCLPGSSVRADRDAGDRRGRGHHEDRRDRDDREGRDDRDDDRYDPRGDRRDERCGCRDRDREERDHHRRGRGRNHDHGGAPRGPEIVPPGGQYCGRDYAGWVQAWWRWAVSFPVADNPLFDRDSCRPGQTGPVVFLSGTFSGAPLRTCTVSDDQAILFPLFTVENDYPCPDPAYAPPPGQSLEDFLTEGAQVVVDEMKSIAVEIDGVPLADFNRYRVTTPLFYFKADPGLTQAFDPCLTGKRQPVVSDGFWLLFEPLPVGVHTLHLHGESQALGLSYDFNWSLTVVD